MKIFKSLYPFLAVMSATLAAVASCDSGETDGTSEATETEVARYDVKISVSLSDTYYDFFSNVMYFTGEDGEEKTVVLSKDGPGVWEYSIPAEVAPEDISVEIAATATEQTPEITGESYTFSSAISVSVSAMTGSGDVVSFAGHDAGTDLIPESMTVPGDKMAMFIAESQTLLNWSFRTVK